MNDSEYYFFQGRIKYEILGDFPAPYFFQVRDDSRRITVANNLKEDKASSYIVSVELIKYLD